MIMISSNCGMTTDGVKVMPVIKPKYPQYVTVQSREETYDIWPKILPQRPELLSRVGFFYIGKLY